MSFKAARFGFFITLSLILLHKALLTLGPILIGQVMDNIMTSHSLRAMWFLAAYLLSGLCAWGLFPTMKYRLAVFIQRTIYHLNVSWSNQILNKEFDFFNQGLIGARTQILDRAIIANEKILHYIFVFLMPSVIEVIIVSIYIIWKGGAELALIMVIFAIIATYLLRQKIIWKRDYVRRLCSTDEQQTGIILELFQAAKTLKIHGAETWVGDHLNQNFSNYIKDASRSGYAQASLGATEKLLLHFGSALVIGMGLWWLHSTSSLKLSGGDFFSLFVLSQYFLGSFLRLAHHLGEIDQAQIESEALHHMLDQHHSFSSTLGSPVLLPTANTLCLSPCQISFNLDNQKQHLTLMETIKIPYGSRVAILGASGQGKTYLAELICGIQTNLPKAAITLGGQDIAELNHHQLLQKIYFMESHSVFMKGDFNQAVLMGHHNQEFDLSIILKDLSLEHLNDYLSATDPRIDQCSAGEKKRLGLLRAFCLNREIMILDEPTESLDTQLCHQIWPQIFQYLQGRTIICITHDLSYLKHFDMLLELRNHQLHLTKIPSSK